MGLLNNIFTAATATAGAAVGAASAAIEIAAENVGNKIAEVKAEMEELEKKKRVKNALTTPRVDILNHFKELNIPILEGDELELWRKHAMEIDYFFFNNDDKRFFSDEYGMTPLMYAVIGKVFFDKRGIGMFATLFNKEDKNIFGHTALDIYLCLYGEKLSKERHTLTVYKALVTREASLRDSSILEYKYLTNKYYNKVREKTLSAYKNLNEAAKKGEQELKLNISEEAFAKQYFKIHYDEKNEKLEKHRMDLEEKKQSYINSFRSTIEANDPTIKDEFETTEEYNKRRESKFNEAMKNHFEEFLATCGTKLNDFKLSEEDILKFENEFENNLKKEAVRVAVQRTEDLNKPQKQLELFRKYMSFPASVIFKSYDADNEKLTVESAYFGELKYAMDRDHARTIKEQPQSFSVEHKILNITEQLEYIVNVLIIFEDGKKFSASVTHNLFLPEDKRIFPFLDN